jgi:hypothetical protein
MKNAKLLIFSDKLIICRVNVLSPEDIGGPDMSMIDPFVVTTTDGEFYLRPWMTEYTAQTEFEIHSDKLLTMAEPTYKLLSKYEEVCK